MSVDKEESDEWMEFVRGEILAEAQEIGRRFEFIKNTPETRSAALDDARHFAERFVGRPCIARWDGPTRIVISHPVIDYRRIHGIHESR